MSRNARGFTLVELMIVVAIIGIVAMIAYPSYNQYILKTHRVEGKELLARAASMQERYFADNNAYTTDLRDLGFPSAIDVSSEHGYYTMSVDDATGNCPITSCYSMTITTAGSQVTDVRCATMTSTSTGRKTATNDDCW